MAAGCCIPVTGGKSFNYACCIIPQQNATAFLANEFSCKSHELHVVHTHTVPCPADRSGPLAYSQAGCEWNEKQSTTVCRPLPEEWMEGGSEGGRCVVCIDIPSCIKMTTD